MQKQVFESVNVRQELAIVREELDDHLEAINDATNEIQSNNEMLLQVMERMEKMAERVDAIAWYLKRKDQSFSDDNVCDVEPLTKREKDVFSALYELNATNAGVTYKDIARRLGMTQALVQSYITALIDKGVPVEKRYVNKEARVALRPAFMTLQAKTNIVGVDSKLTAWM